MIIRKQGKRWLARVNLLGYRISNTFDTKQLAYFWSVKTEYQIIEEYEGKTPIKTFGELLMKYKTDISNNKKGRKWEYFRINKFLREEKELASKDIKDLKPIDFSAYRDRRLKEVSGPSVSRDMGILHHACRIAISEWGWLERNPLDGVRHPKRNRPRDRRIDKNEEKAIIECLGYKSNRKCIESNAKVGCAFLLAIETAMRLGEIAKLKWENINFNSKVAHLIDTKNGDNRRIPLSNKAVKLLKQLPIVSGGAYQSGGGAGLYCYQLNLDLSKK